MNMLRSLLLFSIVVLVFAGCRQCVECTIDLKEAYERVDTIDEYCGTKGDVEDERRRLIESEYACIQCVVNGAFGQTNSGFHCGDRRFVDSLELAWRTGAMEAGLLHNCTYWRDTLEARCVLVQ
jgi:nitrogenase subunit NifH